MNKIRFNHHKTIYVVTVISILFTTSGLRAEEKLSASETLTESTKEFLSDRGRTGSLLGSIIAGAAVANPLAPLLGSVAGFMIGKSSAFSNKDSNATRRQAYINRSLIPEDGVQLTGLTGLTGKPVQASEQTVITGLSEEIGTTNRSEQTEPAVIVGLPGIRTGNQSERPEQIVVVGLPEETEIENQSEQIKQLFNVRLPRQTETGDQSEQTNQTVALELAENIDARINLQKQLAYACSNVQLTQPMTSSCYYYSQ